MNAFVFPGQGSQSLGMGSELLKENPEYKTYLKKANDALGYDLESIIFGDDLEKLTLTQNAQPALLTIEYIYYRYLVEKKEILPDVVAGHSLGEWTALVVAGVLNFEDAVRLVHLRGLYMSQACPPGQGTMAAILGMKPEKINDLLRGFENVVPANFNSSVQTVISGETKEVLEAMTFLKENGAKKVVQLNVSGPFHSPLISNAAKKLQVEVDKVEFKTPSIPIVQNVTAEYETNPKTIKENIIKQITSPVRWVESITNMNNNGIDKFIEVGPGKVLTGLIKRIVKGVELINI